MENTQSMKTGKFISEMRKLQNLTQKDLAQKLGVTDKAISKWERGLSCPDISLLMPLAKILGVTTSELLNGEKITASQQKPAEVIVEETLRYSNKSTELKVKGIRQTILVVLSASFLIAMITCLICDFAITGTLSWSLIVIFSLIFVWGILLPFFKAKNKIIKKSLAVISIVVIPYLATLSWILKLPLIFTLGSCVSIISIIGMWCLYGVFSKFRDRKLCAAGIFFLIAIPITLGINYIIECFVRQQATTFFQNILNTICLLIAAITCFGANYLVAQRNRYSDISVNGR